MSIHNGHRERLKDRFMQQGLNGFNDHNALELLLFYAIPRKDTNPIAHALLDRFGSLAAVLEARPQELMQVPGVGACAACLISLVPQLMRKAMVSKTRDMYILSDVAAAGEYLQPRFLYERDEIVIVLCLDSRKRIICCSELSRGGVNSVTINPRKVVECAVLNRADSLIIAHNHPNGRAMPSVEDRRMTSQIKESLAAVEIRLEDHFIFSDGEYVSMAQLNMMI